MNFATVAQALQTGQGLDAEFAGIRLYRQSVCRSESTVAAMVKTPAEKYLMVSGSAGLYQELSDVVAAGDDWKVCRLTHQNRLVLNAHFPFTIPQTFGKNIATIGLGDRLGLASPGHIQLIRDGVVKPILAQQSIRELNLTGRSYEDVLDAACYAVFQEGYQGGFGADGDHLKSLEDIQMAIKAGISMLTLDCSEKINNDVEKKSLREIEEQYRKLPESTRSYFEDKYLGKRFLLASVALIMERDQLMKNVLIYGEAVRFIDYIYQAYVQPAPQSIDFEVSIDETLTPTTVDAHYFVARELSDARVDLVSLAPRFCGEFQKGIDYIGDLQQFEAEFIIHAQIADHFGYKISVHSGSDKFSVFPIISRYTAGRFHVKTAGTNWLEAVRVVATVNPDLYRRLHQFARDHFAEAQAYYHVTADVTAIRPLDEMTDAQLSEYLQDNNARQLLHITYGILLQAKDEAGRSLFRQEIFRTLQEKEEIYERALYHHIGRHLHLLDYRP